MTVPCLLRRGNSIKFGQTVVMWKNTVNNIALSGLICYIDFVFTLIIVG